MILKGNSTNTLKHKMTSVFFTVFNKIENNNNADFHTNGEERFLERLIGKLTSPVVLFDVGGNVGGYSEILLKKCRMSNIDLNLHIFEPTASCYQLLQNKFSSDPCVRLSNVGVSDHPGSSEIFYDKEQSGFASLYQRNLSSMNVQMEKKETISLIRLEDYITSAGIERIDFMKIDIEGHELKAFEGMGKYLDGKFIKVIQFEYGGANLDSRTNLLDLFTLLESRNFVVGKIMRKSIEVRKYQTWMDNFQYANYVAISTAFTETLLQ